MRAPAYAPAAEDAAPALLPCPRQRAHAVVGGGVEHAREPRADGAADDEPDDHRDEPLVPHPAATALVQEDQEADDHGEADHDVVDPRGRAAHPDDRADDRRLHPTYLLAATVLIRACRRARLARAV